MLCEMPYFDNTVERKFEPCSIPIENRLSHLNLQEPPVKLRMTARSIAMRIGCRPNWVEQKADEIGIFPDIYGYTRRNGVNKYPVATYEVLKGEWDWEKQYDELPEEISFSAMARVLNRHPDWVKKNARLLAFYPGSLDGRLCKYPKEIVDELRNMMLMTPLSADWVTAHYIYDNIPNKSSQWVLSRLEQRYGEQKTPMFSDNYRVHDHYPYSAFLELKAEAERDEAFPRIEDYLTLHDISIAIGHDEDWIKNRLGFVTSVGEPRMDRRGRLHTLYPPTIISELSSLPENILYTDDGWRTARAIRNMTTRTKEWVDHRIGEFEHLAIDKKDKRGRVRKHYPPAVVEKLHEMAKVETMIARNALDNTVAIPEISN